MCLICLCFVSLAHFQTYGRSSVNARVNTLMQHLHLSDLISHVRCPIKKMEGVREGEKERQRQETETRGLKSLTLKKYI